MELQLAEPKKFVRSLFFYRTELANVQMERPWERFPAHSFEKLSHLDKSLSFLAHRSLSK